MTISSSGRGRTGEQPRTVNLDAYANKIDALQQARQDLKQLTAFVEQLEQEIRDAMGDAEVATVFGVKMFTYQRKEAYAWRKFQDAYPHIAREYLITREVQDLDKGRIVAEQADVLREFQTREFRQVSRRAGA